MSLVLCGLPASGKTTVGKLLAEKLGYDFLDTDFLIEQEYLKSYGQRVSCRQIAIREGIQTFRFLENQQVKRLQATLRGVIALGGGTLCDIENVGIIKGLGCLIYLNVSVHAAWNRIEARGIPAYLDPVSPKESFYKVAKERIATYERMAEIVVDVEALDEEGIVEMILKKVSHGK